MTLVKTSNGLLFSTRSGAVFRMATSMPGDTKTQATSPHLKPESKTRDIANWGSGNDFPQKLLEAAEKNSIVPTTIDKKVNFLFGEGLYYWFAGDFDPKTGKEQREYRRDAKVDEFLKRSQIDRYIAEGATDLYYFANVFPQMILNNPRTEIVQLVIQEAMYSRWEVMDEAGKINNCYINANWPETNEKYITKVPTFDPYHPYRVELLKERKEFSYIYQLSYTSPGKSYYQVPNWYSVVKSGWLDVAAAIPEFKKALMKNQITVKYLINIPEEYWVGLYPEWDNMEDDERMKLQGEQLDKIDEWLTNTANAGKSIMNTYQTDEAGREFGKIHIEPIKNEFKGGEYIEDSQEASSHILYALGTDPTILGSSPGRGTGAGSGSDKRVAFNLYQLGIGLHRKLLLEPLEFIRDYNGWPENLRFGFRVPEINTLDSGKETSNV